MSYNVKHEDIDIEHTTGQGLGEAAGQSLEADRQEPERGSPGSAAPTTEVDSV